MQALTEQVFTHQWLRSAEELIRLKRLFLACYLHYLSFTPGADDNDPSIQYFYDHPREYPYR